MTMNTDRESFEQMLVFLMKFVDTINESHAGGVSFGTEHRLYPAEIHTVVAIGGSEGISLTKLAEELNISKPTLSERIRKLTSKGFVEKKKNLQDQKAVTLWLTASGKKACEHHELQHLKMYKMFCAYFGSEAQEKIELFSETFRELMRFEENTEEHF